MFIWDYSTSQANQWSLTTIPAHACPCGIPLLQRGDVRRKPKGEESKSRSIRQVLIRVSAPVLTHQVS